MKVTEEVESSEMSQSGSKVHVLVTQVSDPTCASLLPSVSVPVESLRLGTERRARDAVVMGNVRSRFRGPA